MVNRRDLGSDAGWEPSLGYPRPLAPPVGFDPAPEAAVRRQPRRLAWPGVLALLLVLALGGVVGLQISEIQRLRDQIAALDQRLAAEQAGDRSRFEALEGRTTQLEKRAGEIFDPEAIAEAVEKDRRELFHPPVVRLLRIVNGISPRLGDIMLRRILGRAAAPRRR